MIMTDRCKLMQVQDDCLKIVLLVKAFGILYPNPFPCECPGINVGTLASFLQRSLLYYLFISWQ